MENSEYKKHIIETGMGLQDVDHLKNSSYFVEITKKYVKGEISLIELAKTNPFAFSYAFIAN